MSGTRSRVTVLAVAALLIVAAAAVGVAAVPAAASDDPPEIPAAYYGEVTVDGEPAPEGTFIEAKVDGEVRGSIVVEEEGQYGGPSVGDEKLEVPGSSDADAGEPVTFLINGEEADADPEVEWESGAHEEVALSAEDVGEPPFFAVEIDEAASETTVEPGQNTSVVAEIENEGDATGQAEIEFHVDGELVDEETRTIPAGDTSTVAFYHELEEEGDYEAIVSTQHDEDDVTLTAQEDEPAPPPPPPPPPPDEPDFVLTNLEAPDVVATGETFEATVDVSNVGDEAGETTLIAEFAGEQDQEKVVELEPDETKTRTFEFDADVEPDEYTLSVMETETGSQIETTVTVDDEVAVFELDALEAPDEVEEGETFGATVDVSNVGDVAGETTLIAEFADEQDEEKVIELEPDETETREFEFTADVPPGDHALTVFETESGSEVETSIEVLEETVVEPASFELSNAVFPENIEVGETFEVSVDVTNVGDEEGTTDVTVRLGDTEATESVTLGPGETTTVTFELTADVDAGDHTITLSESATMTELDLQVTADDPSTPLSPWLVIGVIGLILLVLGGGALLAREFGYVDFQLPGGR